MIWPTDGAKLAYTKLKTRRIRLGITLLVSSLLFVAVAGILFTVRGVVSSLRDYSKEGLGSRYILSANPTSTGVPLDNPDLIARAKVLDKEYIAKRKAEAKRLGIDYDPSTETPSAGVQGPAGSPEILNITSVAAKQATAEYAASHPYKTKKDLADVAKTYSPLGTYSSSRVTFGQDQPYVRVLEDGKEKLGTDQIQTFGSASDLSNFISSWQLFDKDLLQPFVLPGQSLVPTADAKVPILAPYSALEKLLGLKALAKTASADEKLARLTEVRAKAAGFGFGACYRNSASQERVSQATSQQDEINRNKANKDYVKPDLLYDIPSEPCGNVRVVQDKRSADTKALDAKQEQFKAAFGATTPVARLISFKVVGIVPDAGGSSSFSIEQIIQSILSSSIGNGWFSASSVVEADKDIAKVFDSDLTYGSNQTYYVEFSSAEAARKFTTDQQCDPVFPQFSPSSTSSVGPGFDPYAECAKQGKYFGISSFGSNSLALDDFQRSFSKFFRIFILVVIVMASLIMMGIVARVVSDSRRETAVFRAIGAKRLDIAQIYLTYVFYICIIIGVIATAGGVLIGAYLQHKYAADTRVLTSVAFNSMETTRTFQFYKIVPRDLLALLGVIFGVGILSTILPLLSNIRRNPIRDMRDER